MDLFDCRNNSALLIIVYARRSAQEYLKIEQAGRLGTIRVVSQGAKFYRCD